MLLVDGDPHAATSIVQMLGSATAQGPLVTRAGDVNVAVQELAGRDIACVLLGAGQGRREMLSALKALATTAPEVPILVIGERHEEGLEAVKAGAQDYLLRSELETQKLQRAIGYAIERKRSQLELSRQALHDPLTGLPNRTLFSDRLTVALDRSRRTGVPVTILFLDVDSFKEVNDSLGHTAGDLLLTVLADRFRTLMRPMDTVARFGGDEFTFLVEGLTDTSETAVIAERIKASAALPISLADGVAEAVLAVSVGAVMVKDPETPPERAIQDADAAMYRAKHRGGNRVEVVRFPDQEAAGERISLERSLRAAIDSSQLRVHYEPRVSIHGDLGLAGFEALGCWEHPDRGMIGPGELSSIAEDTGLTVPVGEWVIQQALGQIGHWRRFRPEMTISVDLSARQFADPDLVPHLARALLESGADPGALWLEVPQEIIERDPEAADRAMGELSELGVRLAIDDFGRGTSSLQSLGHLPVEMLKLHRHFVAALGSGPEQAAVIRALVELGHAHGLSVIADGVETHAQLASVRHLGCDGAQGHLFSQPVPVAGVNELLATR